MNSTQPIDINDFTTSADIQALTPEQKENLLQMAQFFKEDLCK